MFSNEIGTIYVIIIYTFPYERVDPLTQWIHFNMALQGTMGMNSDPRARHQTLVLWFTLWQVDLRR